VRRIDNILSTTRCGAPADTYARIYTRAVFTSAGVGLPRILREMADKSLPAYLVATYLTESERERER
jgi:hypothetical protein